MLLLCLGLVACTEVLEVRVGGTGQMLEFGAGDDLWAIAHDFVRVETDAATSVRSSGRISRACAPKPSAREDEFCLASLLVELMAPAVEVSRDDDDDDDDGDDGDDDEVVGCPSDAHGRATTTRIFVAVPSAMENVARRAAIRRTWCRRAARVASRHGGAASVRVVFFVGESEDASREAAMERERILFGDVVRCAGVLDAAATVTAKMMVSLQFFAAEAARGEALSTHYVRVEDDVYFFADRFVFEARRRDHSVAEVWGDFYDSATWPGLRYPRGFCVAMSGGLARALGSAHAAVGLGARGDDRPVGAEPRPAGAKGGWVRGAWWHDDAFLGLVLHPFDARYVDDDRIHDLPARGPGAARVTHASIAVNAVQTDLEFQQLHRGERVDRVGAARAWRRGADGALVVAANVDSQLVELRVSDPRGGGGGDDDDEAATATSRGACHADAAVSTASLCEHFQSLPDFECANVHVALVAVCDDAAATESDSEADWTLGFRRARPAGATTPPPPGVVLGLVPRRAENDEPLRESSSSVPPGQRMGAPRSS